MAANQRVKPAAAQRGSAPEAPPPASGRWGPQMLFAHAEAAARSPPLTRADCSRCFSADDS